MSSPRPVHHLVAQASVSILSLTLRQPDMRYSVTDSWTEFPNSVLEKRQSLLGFPPPVFRGQAMQDLGRSPESGDRARERREEFLRRRLPDGGIRPPEPPKPEQTPTDKRDETPPE